MYTDRSQVLWGRSSWSWKKVCCSLSLFDDKQFKIINIIYEPREEECEWKPDEEDEISERLKEKAKTEDEKKI